MNSRMLFERTTLPPSLEQGVHSHGGLSEKLGHLFLIAGLEDAIDET